MLDFANASLHPLNIIFVQCQARTNVFLSSDTRNPAAIAFRTRETLNELFAIHTTLANGNAHDGSFLLANDVKRFTRLINEWIKYAGGELEELKQLAQFIHFRSRGFVTVAVGSNGFFGFGALSL